MIELISWAGEILVFPGSVKDHHAFTAWLSTHYSLSEGKLFFVDHDEMLPWNEIKVQDGNCYRVFYQPFPSCTIWDLMKPDQKHNSEIILQLTDDMMLDPRNLHHELVKYQEREGSPFDCFDRFGVDHFPYWIDFDDPAMICRIVRSYIHNVLANHVKINRVLFPDGSVICDFA